MAGRRIFSRRDEFAEQHQAQKQNEIIKLLNMPAEKAHREHAREPGHRPAIAGSESLKREERPGDPGRQADLVVMPLAGLGHQIRSRQVSTAPDDARDPAPTQSADEKVAAPTAPPQVAREHPTRQAGVSDQQERPVRGIEQAALRIAQPSRSFEQIRIPQRNLPVVSPNLPGQRPERQKLSGEIVPAAKLRSDQQTRRPQNQRKHGQQHKCCQQKPREKVLMNLGTGHNETLGCFVDKEV